MGSFPPPTASDIVHQPDDAPFLTPERRSSRRSLWIALGIVALLAIVAVGLLVADEFGEDDNATTSGESTTGRPATSDDANRSGGATVVEPTGSSDPDGLPASAEPTSFTPDPDEPGGPDDAEPAGPDDPGPGTPQTSTTLAAPGADVAELTISRVIVSPGKSGGNPVDGAVPVLPGVVPTYPSSTGYVCIFWNAAGMPNDVPNGIIWTLDGRVVGSLDDTTFRWNAGSTVRPNWCVPSRPSGLEDGRHRVEYYVAGERKFVAEFVIGD